MNFIRHIYKYELFDASGIQSLTIDQKNMNLSFQKIE